MKACRTRAGLYAISLIVILLDRLTKLWVARHIELNWGSIPVIPSFFSLTHVENTGAAFSLLANAPAAVRVGVLVTFSSVAMIAICIILWRVGAQWSLLNVSLSLVLGGAAGNLWDRVIRQRVTDFLHVYYGNWSWPDFNVADSAIVVGACLLMFEILFPRKTAA